MTERHKNTESHQNRDTQTETQRHEAAKTCTKESLDEGESASADIPRRTVVGGSPSNHKGGVSQPTPLERSICSMVLAHACAHHRASSQGCQRHLSHRHPIPLPVAMSASASWGRCSIGSLGGGVAAVALLPNGTYRTRRARARQMRVEPQADGEHSSRKVMRLVRCSATAAATAAENELLALLLLSLGTRSALNLASGASLHAPKVSRRTLLRAHLPPLAPRRRQTRGLCDRGALQQLIADSTRKNHRRCGAKSATILALSRCGSQHRPGLATMFEPSAAMQRGVRYMLQANTIDTTTIVHGGLPCARAMTCRFCTRLRLNT